MSYILEALKKSDQQRQQGATPTLTSIQIPVEEAGPRIFPWLVALAATVFIAGILIGWLQPWKSEPSASAAASVTPSVAARPAQAPDPIQAQAPKPAPAFPPAQPQAVVQAQQQPVKLIPPAVTRADAAPTVVRSPVVVTSAAVATREPAAAVPARPAVAAEQNVIAKAELPPTILQELPPMAISLHAYSTKPANRLVGINEKLLQEGDALVPGLVLEEVTRKDMIFSYKGYRFRQGVQ
jgi:general secretion pathway protein B